MAKQSKGKVKTQTVERCIYLKSGSFYVVKRNKWSDPFSTLEKALIERGKIEAEQISKPSGGPFVDFVKKYFYPHYLDKMKENTQWIMKVVNEKCIFPYFANKKIAEIISIDILDFQQHLLKTGRLANVTINHRVGLLRMIFAAAVDLNFIKSNPTDKIKPLRVEKKDRIVLTELEIIKLLSTINHPYKYAFTLAGLTGARASEVMGFKWEDFNLDNNGRGKITFKRQINMKHNIDDLKTKGSIATLPMIKPVTKLLIEWKKKCPDPEWLFQGEVAKQISKSYVNIGGVITYRYHRPPRSRKYKLNNGHALGIWWCHHRASYDLSNMRLHDFRHSFATNMITRCKNIKTAQKLCRHANINTTLEIYAHVHPEQLEEVWDWDF